jgi:hypothetical protein
MLRYPDPKLSFGLELVAFIASILPVISAFVTATIR